jgi:DNA-binding transcriptional LysR family regulator
LDEGNLLKTRSEIKLIELIVRLVYLIVMKLNSQHLEAFLAIAQTLNFTEAAKEVHVTQSALSQRIAKLEDELETTLFIRDRGKIRLTEEALELLRYCENQSQAEEEVIKALKGAGGEVSGRVRVGGFSSVMRSIVLPAMGPLALKHKGLSFQFFTKEIRELEDLLRRSEVDYIITTKDSESPDIESVFLGTEENVLVASKKHKMIETFLDHDSHDETTSAYFRQNKIKLKPKRMSYMDDVYGLIDGVREGFGKAILPRHLIVGDSNFVVLDPDKTLKVKTFLQYYKRPFYRRAHEEVLDHLIKRFSKSLTA